MLLDGKVLSIHRYTACITCITSFPGSLRAEEGPFSYCKRQKQGKAGKRYGLYISYTMHIFCTAYVCVLYLYTSAQELQDSVATNSDLVCS